MDKLFLRQYLAIFILHPHGHLTKTQFDLNQTILVNETVAKVETFTQIFKNFFKYNAGEDIDIKISKLELFIKLFDHGHKKPCRNQQ